MMNIKGNALFDFRIDKNGKVNDVRVIELPFGVFEKDVIESINELENSEKNISSIQIIYTKRLKNESELES